MKKWVLLLVGLVVVLGAVSIFVYFQGSLTGAGAMPVGSWYFPIGDIDYLVITYPPHISGKLLVFNKVFSPIIKLGEPKISESEVLDIADEFLTTSEDSEFYWSAFGYEDKDMLKSTEPKITYDKNDGCFWNLRVLYGNETIGALRFDAKTGEYMVMSHIYESKSETIRITQEEAKSILRDEGIEDIPDGYYVSLVMADIRGYINE